MHTSVGAIIKNKEGKILMIDRAAFPYGWACPAGHMNQGETPEQALIREIKEEVNLDIKNPKLLFHQFIDWNKCVKGIKGHDWYVYEIGDWSEEVERSKRETKDIGWFSVKEIRNLLASSLTSRSGELEEIWKYWFEKLRII